ncbi:AAA family ATPase [Pseudorhizobium marinum]|uniref:AAA family ATPase n=1 Tax=Pseudorhizobium marinum TaxID=1496690 RepID=UPI0004977A2D|nr:AAA family ATPase [Pseudorhizobium marinum]
MREDEFKQWLQDGGADAVNAGNTRAFAVRTIEKNLKALGSPHNDLESAYQDDQFAQLRQRLKEMRSDEAISRGDFRILMPQSENPLGRLSSWRSWLGQYGRFLSGEVRAPRDADRIRQYVLERYIEPAREQNAQSVDVLVRDVNSALGLNDGWPNICQVLAGPNFQEFADVSPPERIGAPVSPATVFRFGFDGAAPLLASEPTNLILYGPPGTGKTFETAVEAVRLCGEHVSSDRQELMTTYHQLLHAGRIEFVTFHQSLSYEDFVEGLRPSKGAEDASVGFELKAEPGVFRRIARRAETSTGPGDVTYSLAGRQIFKMSIGAADDPVDAHLFEEAIAGGYTLLGYEDIDWSDERFSSREKIIEAVRVSGVTSTDKPTAFSGRVQFPFIFRNNMKKGDMIIVSKGNSLFRAIGEVTGDYQFAPREGGDYGHRRAVKWLWVDRAGVPVTELYTRAFTQKCIYLLTQSELNIAALERYAASQQDAGRGAPEPFVLIIDEINRANISKVFGELITLLEPDKRLGQLNELKVRLPYSKEPFGVPANLHVLGTMNTADRSIALLDTALRRRFRFRELMPDPSKLANVEGINLSALLTTLNERIEYLFDREHQIGHAYFINCRSKSQLDEVMRHKIIPLLSEYFYGDLQKVAIVLGDADNREGDRQGNFLDRQRLKVPKGVSANDEDLPHRYRWSVRDEFSYQDFMAA